MENNYSISQEITLIKHLNCFSAPAEIPLRFNLDGVAISGISEDFHPTVDVKTSEYAVQTVIIGERDGLSIRAECMAYKDFPVTEWVAFLTNNSTKALPVISKLNIGYAVFPGKSPYIDLCSGDNGEMDSFIESSNVLDKPVSLSPIGGRSCNAAWPYIRLVFENYGINIAVGWPGQWQAVITPVDEGIAFTAGQQRMNMRLNPQETIRTPRITLMGFGGNKTQGINNWRRWFVKHILVREKGQPLSPKYCMYNSGDGDEFTAATVNNQLTAINTALKNGFKPDVWWIDAGWYACNGNWRNTGTWKPDIERFPNGLVPIGKVCERNDIDLLLWFEPERVRLGTELALEHPEWLLSRNDAILRSDLQSIMHPGMRLLTDSYLLNLADDACCDWLIDYIDTMIKENEIKIYRQDLNFNLLPYWIENESPDRIGALENHHIMNYLRFWDTLIERNPNLLIDSCAGGGRRNDLETMRRSVPLHMTDVGYGIHPYKQMHAHVMFQWLPYFKGIPMNLDNSDGYYDGTSAEKPIDRFAYHCAMAPMMTVRLGRTTDESLHQDEAMLTMTQEMLSIWKRAAQIMLTCDYFPLSELRHSEEDYYAVQFHDPVAHSGYIQVIRNTRAAENVFLVRPVLTQKGIYCFENSESGLSTTLTSNEIEAGIELRIPVRSGIILFYQLVS